MQRLIVGLGNPGSAYQMTRHNVGFLVVEALAKREGWTFKEESRFMGFIAKGKIRGVQVHLLKPTTFMNLSGQSVGKYAQYYKFSPDEILVISDDVALPFGRMRLRERGSSGGHNGLKSIETHLGTNHYSRLRLGIGRDGRKELSDYVLAKFSQQEKEELESAIDSVVDITDRWLDSDFDKVVKLANTPPTQIRKNIPQQEEK